MRPPSKSEVSIEVDGRLHLGLISMHATARRMNGGIGFGVAGLGATVRAEASERLSLADNRRGAFSGAELELVRTKLTEAAKLRNWTVAAAIQFSGELPTHIGLGSGTALRLAAIEALSLINNDDLSRDDLVKLSGRGGTSGIGIQTYFDGGLFMDLGVARHDARYLPSSRALASRVPRTLPRLIMPNWNMVACLPKSIPFKSQGEEIAFFAQTTPIPEPESHRAAYIALFDIYASALDADYNRFCEGVERMQTTHWKSAEIGQYGEPLSQLREDVRQLGADCSGLSSLGPAIFAMGSKDALRKICDRQAELDCIVVPLSPSTGGRRVKYN
ncbi:beta-ribofuranosylaminobenzene 5'-phosphate synthase family protein [Qipengyuania sp. MTN3-11]|uniref:beta-ribofuranosylaminobenzene 5'-phosphate synthase family protein n=1 Tax=Qipengyuania sp. MTN3-11 TaxID=3056557 RepID=UPI0036F3897B